MLDVIEKLLTLQDRDQRLRSFQAELAHLPEERKIREKQIADSAAQLDTAKIRAKEIEIEKRNLEMEARTKRDAIARYRQQQLQTRKNEEYAALAHEIEAAEKAIIALEDRELDLMEDLEKLTPQIAAAERTHAEERDKLEHLLAALESKKSKSRNAHRRPQQRTRVAWPKRSTKISSNSTCGSSKPSTAPPSQLSSMKSARAVT